MVSLRVRRYLLAAHCAVIFALSSISDYTPLETAFPFLSYVSDVVPHFVLYFMLASFAHLDFAMEKPRFLSSRAAMFAVLFSFLFGVSDEFHQRFVPGRHFDVKDMTVDLISSVCAVIIIQKAFNAKALADNGIGRPLKQNS